MTEPLRLEYNLPNWEGHNLEVEKIASVFKNITNSYKYWWSLALLDVIEHDRKTISVHELILIMLSKAYSPYATYHFSFGLQDMLPLRIEQLEAILLSRIKPLCNSLSIPINPSGLPCKIEEFFSLKALNAWLLPVLLASAKTQQSALLAYYHELLLSSVSTTSKRFSVDENCLKSFTGVQEDSSYTQLLRDLVNDLQSYAKDLAQLKNWVPDRFLYPWNGTKKASDLSNMAPYCIVSSKGQPNLSSSIITDLYQDLGRASFAMEVKRITEKLLPNLTCKSKDLLVFNPLYLGYLKQNLTVLRSFTYQHLAEYMEKHNRLMPAIVSKLYEVEEQRNNLKTQHSYFESYIRERGPLQCIYNKELFEGDSNYALDHFIPWSFVHHDMIWNLTPIDQSSNSSKSNNLPSLDFIEPLCQQHQKLLQFHFEKAARSNTSTSAHKAKDLHTDDLDENGAVDHNLDHDNRLGKVYNRIVEDYLEISKGSSIFDLTQMSSADFRDLIAKEIKPSYDVALNQGFKAWDM